MEDARNGDAEKGIPQHVPKKMANQKLSKESELREGKNEKKRKRDLPRRWGQDMLYLQKSKIGEPTVPREAQKKEASEKRRPQQSIRSKDPQEPSISTDPFRYKEKGRLGQLDRKKTEEENKK